MNIPNATQGITYTHLDVMVGETTPLNPTGANYANDHKWYIDGVEQPDWQQAQTTLDISGKIMSTYKQLLQSAMEMLN